MTKDELMQDDEIHEAFLALKQTIIDAVPFWVQDSKKRLRMPFISMVCKKIMSEDIEVADSIEVLIEKIMEKQ